MDSNQLSVFIGEKIMISRRRKKMTQKQLGDMLGVKNNTVSAYERGAISINQDILFKLSEILDVNIGDFFPQKEKAPH